MRRDPAEGDEDRTPIGSGSQRFDDGVRVVRRRHLRDLSGDHLAPVRRSTEALVTRRRRQPCAGTLGLAKAVDVLDEAQPHGLGHVGGLGAEQAAAPDHRPHEP